ncbi:MAG TPA: hypothetical protein VMI11_08345 [Actinomycetes bacterium]|nr:hypothetical protein [Actinomycetes bacterium]
MAGDLTSGVDARLNELEERVAVLTEAVRTLARGLEGLPGGPDGDLHEARRAGALAREVLLSEKT